MSALTVGALGFALLCVVVGAAYVANAVSAWRWSKRTGLPLYHIPRIPPPDAGLTTDRRDR